MIKDSLFRKKQFYLPVKPYGLERYIKTKHMVYNPDLRVYLLLK